MYRYRYREASIGKYCRITRDCGISRDVELGGHSHLCSINLKPGSRIGRHFSGAQGCVVGQSQLGDHCNLEMRAAVYGSSLEGWNTLQAGASVTDVALGAYSYVARNTSLNQVTVGRFCSIGPGTIIGSGEHPTYWASSAPVFYSTLKQCGATFVETDTFAERRPISIGNDVCIGAHCFVRDGVTIGDGAFLAAGSVVVSDVPAYAVVGGVPARTLRYRFEESIRTQLLAIAWWNWDEADLHEAQALFVDADISKLIAWAEAHVKPEE